MLNSVSYKNDVSGKNNSAVELLSLRVNDDGVIKLGVLSGKGTVCTIVLNSVSYNSDLSGGNNSAVELLSLWLDDFDVIKLGVLCSEGYTV